MEIQSETIIDMTEDLEATSLPAKVTLPKLPFDQQAHQEKRTSLSHFAKRISKIKPSEPPPVQPNPRPKVHQRPTRGFD